MVFYFLKEAAADERSKEKNLLPLFRLFFFSCSNNNAFFLRFACVF